MNTLCTKKIISLAGSGKKAICTCLKRVRRLKVFSWKRSKSDRNIDNVVTEETSEAVSSVNQEAISTSIDSCHIPVECLSSDFQSAKNKKRAKRVRCKNGVAEIEKSQKTESIFDVEENDCVTGNSANISLSPSLNNDEASCKNRVMMVGQQVEDAEKVSEPWRFVAKPRTQHVGQSDDVVPCTKEQQCVNKPDRIRSYHTGKSSSVRYRSGSETKRTKRVAYSLSDPTRVLSPNSVSAFGSHEDDSGSIAKRTRVQTDVEDFECQYSSDLEFESNQNDELKESNEDLKRQLKRQQEELEQTKINMKKLVELVTDLLKEKANVEEKERRQRCMENNRRLGQFVMQKVDEKFQELWMEGYAYQEISRKREEIKSEIEELDRQKTMLAKTMLSGGTDELTRANRQSPRTRSSTAITDDTVLYSETVPPGLSWREYREANDILKLRISTLKKEYADLIAQKKALDLERNVHVEELKMFDDEDESHFKNRPLLNDQYLFLTFLGKGGYGEVYKAFDLKEQRYVACKVNRFNEDWLDTKKAYYKKHTLREYNIHKSLNHPHIVKLYDMFNINETSFCTVLEYCDGHDLNFHLKQHKTLPEKEARSIIMQVVSAVNYLNEISPAVIHYDLKPANILLIKGNDEIKICDFGISKVMDKENYDLDYGMNLSSQGAGTYWYLPPECFEFGEQPPKISSKVDVWSIGVIFYECLYGVKPFCEDEDQATIWEEKMMLNATDLLFPTEQTVSNEAKSFIRDCLAYHKENRIDVATLFWHEYFMNDSCNFENSDVSESACNQHEQ